MQKIILHGNLGRDAEYVSFGERQQLKFSVACTEGKGDKKTTTWYDVLYGLTAIQPYLKKGKDVIVVGRLVASTYNGKDGGSHLSLNVYADSVELCGGRDQSQAAPAPVQRPAPQPEPIEPNDLPF